MSLRISSRSSAGLEGWLRGPPCVGSPSHDSTSTGIAGTTPTSLRSSHRWNDGTDRRRRSRSGEDLDGALTRSPWGPQGRGTTHLADSIALTGADSRITKRSGRHRWATTWSIHGLPPSRRAVCWAQEQLRVSSCRVVRGRNGAIWRCRTNRAEIHPVAGLCGTQLVVAVTDTASLPSRGPGWRGFCIHAKQLMVTDSFQISASTVTSLASRLAGTSTNGSSPFFNGPRPVGRWRHCPGSCGFGQMSSRPAAP